jgi:hypothetical protein
MLSVDSHISNHAKVMVMVSLSDGLETYLATQFPHGSRGLEPGELTGISSMMPRYSKSTSFGSESTTRDARCSAGTDRLLITRSFSDYLRSLLSA